MPCPYHSQSHFVPFSNPYYWFSRIETLALSLFAVARSLLPSPLKSPIATEAGLPLMVKFVANPNDPVPVPSRIETVPLLL